MDKTQAVREIIKRHGETEIIGKYSTEKLSVTDTEDGLLLLHADGWRHYSNKFGSRRAQISYLAGQDDNGPWAVRIAGNITMVKDAIDWLEPLAVKQARAGGRTPRRQGDVYCIPDFPDHAEETAAKLPNNHNWDPITRTLSHHDSTSNGHAHKPIIAPFPCSFHAQRAYRMGRSGRRGGAD